MYWNKGEGVKKYMAFIISKTSTGWGKTRRLFYLVENYRVNGKVKRRCLLSLRGFTSVADYLTVLLREEKRLQEVVSQTHFKNIYGERYAKNAREKYLPKVLENIEIAKKYSSVKKMQ